MEHLPATTQPAENPFGRMLAAGSGMNVGAIAIEQERAIAEAQGQLTLAKRFPRSMAAAMSEFLDTCASPEFAKTAFYAVPNRGSGPSIRFAEEAARCYGNFQYGHRELSRQDGRSEIEVFAWDMQNNNYSKRQITVMHVVDTKNGPKKLVDQADIDNKIANVASKQMRGRILALLPKHLVASGIEACKQTLAGNSEVPIRERILKMSQAFGRFGVTDTHLQAYLKHPVDQTTVDELADLMGIYNAIKEGAKASDYFQLGDEGAAQTASPAAAAIAKQAAQNQAAAPEAAQAPAQAPAPAPAATRRRAATSPDAAAQQSAAPSNDAKTESNAVKEQPAESAQNTAAAQEPAANNQSAEDDVF